MTVHKIPNLPFERFQVFRQHVRHKNTIRTPYTDLKTTRTSQKHSGHHTQILQQHVCQRNTLRTPCGSYDNTSCKHSGHHVFGQPVTDTLYIRPYNCTSRTHTRDTTFLDNVSQIHSQYIRSYDNTSLTHS